MVDTTLTHAQLAMYAQAAGVRDTDTAAAIAQAESGGRTRAHNLIPPDDSYGPWQINMLGALGPARRKALGISSNTDLYDPAVNARAMAMISRGGTDWSPWSTYKAGTYRKYLTGSSTSSSGTAGSTAQDVVSNPLGSSVAAAEDAVKLATDAANWIVNPRSWVRVAYVVGGVAVVLVGLNLLLQNAILGRVSGALGGDKSASAGQSTKHIARTVVGGGGKKKAAAAAAKKTAAAPAAKKAAAARPATEGAS